MKVGILGATGSVGQQLIHMLDCHPTFEVTQLFGKKSTGKKYGDVDWILPGNTPSYVEDIKICSPSEISHDVELVFSALPPSAAESIEVELAQKGKIVISNASAHRMEEDIPLLIPEVNPGHLDLLRVQAKTRKWKGVLITNPNCSTIILNLVLKPLLDAYGIEKVIAVTLQAVSGAGYPGLPSLDILGNVIPYIKGEEEKLVKETSKILGTFIDGRISPSRIEISATCTRVPTIDGHLINGFVQTVHDVEIEEVVESLQNFSGVPQKLNLPTAPERPIRVTSKVDRPQTRFDLDPMAVVVGRIRKINNMLAFTILGHNTMRGAAGASILNAELFKEVS